jgi:hypothetical protein
MSRFWDLGTYDYDAFGNNLATSGSAPNNHLFRGRICIATATCGILSGFAQDQMAGIYCRPAAPIPCIDRGTVEN